MIFLKVLIQVRRNRTFFLLSLVNIFSSGLLHNVYISHKLAVLTNWEMKRSNLLAVKLSKLIYYLTIADIVHVHIGNENHTRKFVLLAQIPCLLGTNLYAGFTRYYDDCCVCSADSFLDLSYEIKISGSVQNVYLVLLPRDRNHRCSNGKVSFDLFFIIITDSVAVFHFT